MQLLDKCKIIVITRKFGYAVIVISQSVLANMTKTYFKFVKLCEIKIRPKLIVILPKISVGLVLFRFQALGNIHNSLKTKKTIFLVIYKFLLVSN